MIIDGIGARVSDNLTKDEIDQYQDFIKLLNPNHTSSKNQNSLNKARSNQESKPEFHQFGKSRESHVHS